MVRLFGFLSCFVVLQSFSQTAKDTVRDKIDYRRNTSAFYSPEESADRPTNHYVGVQANQLLRQLFNLSGSTTSIFNPYTLTYTFNNSDNGNGLSLGIGFNSQNISDEDQGIKRETSSNDIFFRFGYEKKSSIGKRWILGRGFDAILTNQKRDTKTTQGTFTSEFNTASKGWGLGARASLLFHVNGIVYLGTETTWYYQSIKSTIENKISGSPNQDSDSKNTSFSLQVPVAIFLLLKF